MLALLKTFSWRELLHHPWRSLVALLAVACGVALAFSVHLINSSAVSEFGSAARALNGQPDLVLRALLPTFDDGWLERVGRHPEVALASPVLEVNSYALVRDRADGALSAHARAARRVAVRVLGVDALVVAAAAPALAPRPFAEAGRLSLFAPDAAFLNAAAFEALGIDPRAPDTRQLAQRQTMQLQSGMRLLTLQVLGSVARPDDRPDNDAGAARDEPIAAPLIVMDVAAAQELFDKVGQLSRIDLRLRPGADAAQLARSLELPPGLFASEPAHGETRIGQLSRAYRVNLAALSLVALFTGAFLAHAALSLGVVKRAAQFALLAVLGLTARQRMAIVLFEALALGLVASALGITLGTGLAALALRLLDGDLGGGYFQNVAPMLLWEPLPALAYFALGVGAACVGAWWPARLAQRLSPAATLKGAGVEQHHGLGPVPGLALLLVGAGAAMLPPWFELPLGAYLGVGLVLGGGVLLLPPGVAWLAALAPARLLRQPLALLAIERARRLGHSAATAVGAVVVSLSLAVALTVMVASFRLSMLDWLGVVLPADLYLRTAASSSAGENVYLTPDALTTIAATKGVLRVQTTATRLLQLSQERPAVVLLARPLAEPQRQLPLLGVPLAVPPGQIGLYVSEAMVDLYGLRPGARATLIEQALSGDGLGGRAGTLAASAEQAPVMNRHQPLFVAGVWRDYVRQFGTLAIDLETYRRLSGDQRINEVALWLQAGADIEQVRQTLQERLDGVTAPGLIEIASSTQLRATSLRIFDRSFAVTYWLQALAIGIGLFGIATNFSAQTLARRREFGLLAHIGLTRRQILALVALEGFVLTLVGCISGLALGLAIGFILVNVVNPQSFHWSMDLHIPWLRLLALCLAVVAAGTLTAWLAGRAAASADAVAAVNEDW